MLAIKTILHPTDFTAQSDYAFQVASSLASDYQAQLVILHVVHSPTVFGDGFAAGTADWNDGLKEELLELEVPDEHVNVVRQLEEGQPAAEILHLARLSHADLIVMGTHGRQGLNRLFMGSVAENVMREARCPVLIVRSPVARV